MCAVCDATVLSPNDLILCDFDGTISREDTGLAMIRSLPPAAAAQAWEAEFAWRRGEIDSMECLRRQWGLLHKTPAQIRAWLDTLSLDEGFFALLQLARSRGAGIAVLSDGLDFYVEHLLGRHSVRICADDHCVRSDNCLLCFANHAELRPEGIDLAFPYRSACGRCGNCKKAHVTRLRPGFSRVIYIGDGHSDLCAAREADLIFAKDALAEDFSRAGRAFIRFTDLSDILRCLR